MSDHLLARYAAVGADRYISLSEAGLDTHPRGRRLWDVYDRHFGQFTGAGRDPSFRRLEHGERRMALPRFDLASMVVVVGDAPLDPSTTAALRRHRGSLAVLASPAGALELQRQGLHANLVLVEGLDREHPFSPAAVDGRTACLVDRSTRVTRDAEDHFLRVAATLPTWGPWPATAVALAIAGAAPIVGLAGVRLSGSTRRGEALAALLDLLAQQAPARCVLLEGDTRFSPAWRLGWNDIEASLEPDARVGWVDRGSARAFLEEARHDLARLGAILPDARRALALALDARDGRSAPHGLSRAVEIVLAWGADPSLRWALQRGLGLAFLPRLWRLGVAMNPAGRLWRPLVLVLQELVGQADRLAACLDRGVPDAAIAPSGSAGVRRGPVADRVTAVVPVLGGHVSHLADALASLFAQTYADVEVVVVHDGTVPARLEAILRAAPADVRRLELPGATLDEALNGAIGAASGEFIAHHDADGISHPQRLARQVAFLRRHPEIDVVGAASVVLGPAAVSRGDLGDPHAQTPDTLARLLASTCPLAHGSVLVRRDVVLNVGGYRPPGVGTSPRIDHDLWLRLRPVSRFAQLPTRLYARTVSFTRAGELAPAGAGDGHAPAGAECALADAQSGRGLAALELR